MATDALKLKFIIVQICRP